MESLYFRNLLLLGFDVEANTAKHGIQFFPEMFRTANVKGMEVIFYFLLQKLNPNQTKEVIKYITRQCSELELYDL
jgi:hypothetical protein